MSPQSRRRSINMLADALEDVSGRAVTWLRAKAERKRVKPLAFPTPFEEMMDRITRPMIERMAKDVAFMSGNVWGDIPYVKVKDDAEPFTMNRIRPIKYDEPFS